MEHLLFQCSNEVSKGHNKIGFVFLVLLIHISYKKTNSANDLQTTSATIYHLKLCKISHLISFKKIDTMPFEKKTEICI